MKIDISVSEDKSRKVYISFKLCEHYLNKLSNRKTSNELKLIESVNYKDSAPTWVALKGIIEKADSRTNNQESSFGNNNNITTFNCLVNLDGSCKILLEGMTLESLCYHKNTNSNVPQIIFDKFKHDEIFNNNESLE
eukprot:CAMPEP_0116990844 /NCGR_PEP_ID=MMETSP0467-20121206/65742_1 /TAXON_ID=283647 /ORGANISM="Mesodinium pulex, Strain SPMC105" /LENGTH=136 /DNA_ID=CAMNT_0004687729 /DNA_START=650 /DNA_END=1060 /DNA_ORIENTATION=-